MLDLQHNIVSLLFAANGMLSTYRERLAAGQFQNEADQLQTAQSTIERVAQILERAMQITKRLCLILKPCNHMDALAAADIRKTWRRVKETLGSSLDKTGVDLVEHIPKNFPPVKCHPRDLDEILSILAENALQAMLRETLLKPGKLILRTELSLRGEETCALITLADTGPGIEDEVLRRLFLPFFTTKGQNGNGLGLFVAKQLAEKNRGKISVSSFRGCGTSFALEFALAEAQEQTVYLAAS